MSAGRSGAPERSLPPSTAGRLATRHRCSERRIDENFPTDRHHPTDQKRRTFEVNAERLQPPTEAASRASGRQQISSQPRWPPRFAAFHGRPPEPGSGHAALVPRSEYLPPVRQVPHSCHALRIQFTRKKQLSWL